MYLIYLVVLALVSGGCATHRGGVIGRAAAAHPASAPANSTLAITLESSDERLRAMLWQLAAVRNADAHRRVAFEYRRLGVLDMAHEHFSEAIRLDPADAVSYDARARLWRDWGVPRMALDDAKRAVLYAPKSAAAANTLGTVFQALREPTEAKRWYAKALALDPGASYALNNLCYAAIMTREFDAVATCNRAVAAAPDSNAARNNLALAYAAANDMTTAEKWFKRAGDTATAKYNFGIAMMARREYDEAEQAFHAALLADPEFTLAASRARQARVAAQAEEQTGDSH